MGCPGGCGASWTKVAVERGGGWAGVGWFEGVDGGGLDVQRERRARVFVLIGLLQAVDDHAGDLACDDVVGYPEGCQAFGGGVVGKEVEELAVDAVQISSVLPAVV